MAKLEANEINNAEHISARDGENINAKRIGNYYYTGSAWVRGTADADGHLQVDVLSGGGGGVQYTEGDIDATLTGTIALAEGPSDTATPLQVDASKHLQVDIAADSVGIGGGTQYTEDVPAVADPVGTVNNLIRQDIPATLTTTDGDNVAQRGTNYGAAYTQIVTSAGAYVDTFGGGTQYTEDAAAAADPVGTALNLIRDDARGGSLTTTNGDNVSARGTNAGELYVKHVDAIPVTQSGTWDEVGINDSGNSITVDGSVTADTELPTAETPADNLTNATAAPRVNALGYVFDGTAWDRALGNSTDGTLVNLGANNDVTVTGTVTANLAAGTNNIGDVDVLSIAAGDNNIGNVDVVTMPNVTLAAGTNTNEVVGDVAEDVALAGNPVRTGVRASTAIPTAMSNDGDIVTPWANRSGAQVITQAPHVGLNGDPWNLAHECAQYTTTQTSTVLVAGGASEKIVVTKVQIQAGGTTAGTLQLYFGTAAYSRGTSRAIFDGEFAPSATLKPGVVMDGPFIAGTNGDDLMVTTSAAINPLTISVWYYVIT